MKNLYVGLLLTLGLLWSSSCRNNETQTKLDPAQSKIETVQEDSTETKASSKVTFVELGSVNCIPCKMMQPVMEAVDEDFGDQIKIIFHDVWKDRAPAEQYRIRVIPTQVFLDESGKEFFRHEGYFPKEEIDKLLIDKGLKKKDQTKPKKSQGT
jgi:thioredoxin 1